MIVFKLQFPQKANTSLMHDFLTATSDNNLIHTDL